MSTSMRDRVPTHARPTTLDVPLYPRSAQALYDLIEQARVLTGVLDGAPHYVLTDIANFHNRLRSHLQRVAIGE